MYSRIPRSAEYKHRLLEFVRNEHGIETSRMTPAKRGYYGETWRLDTTDSSYFLKLDYSAGHQSLYERSFVVMEHLRTHGVDFISRVIKATDGRLSTRFDGAVLGVFAWIVGENVQNEHTKRAEYGLLAKIYAVPYHGLALAREDFSTASVDLFFRQWERLRELTDANSRQLAAVLERYRDRLQHRAERLFLFAERCQSDRSHFYLTHGDAGGNVIVADDKYYIVDWDDPRLAPPERDAWFCLYWDWAMTAFNNALRGNGINYTLRPERLAYYCYHSFFFYLTEYITTYFDIGAGDGSLLRALAGYFDGWIEAELEYADKMS